MADFQFTVDKAHARSVNDTIADVRRLQISAVVFALVLAALGAWLLTKDAAWSIILGAVLLVGAVSSLWVAVWAPRKVGSVESLYEKSPLVPAIVTELHPRAATLSALIDIGKSTTGTPNYALVSRNVRLNPKWRVGDRIPSVALRSDRSTRSKADTWQMVSPMPIEWGTRDSAVLARATAAISVSEWNFLQSKMADCEKARTHPDRRIPVDPADLPDSLR
ncbi:hypothetical protein ABH922_000515 [Rhodococcus sp. 27YEA15]|uniref:DUF3239 domain-containing protein n=1 Tax=Rhodococcus sp. 27YEA15 TaxID=3156259 RepID=UPI003C7ECF7C